MNVLEDTIYRELQDAGFDPTVKQVELVASDLARYFIEFHSDDIAEMAVDSLKEITSEVPF